MFIFGCRTRITFIDMNFSKRSFKKGSNAEGFPSIQCIVTSGGSWASNRSGTTYLAEYGDYTAICAKPGDSNIREDYLANCGSYSYLCMDYTMSCLRDVMKSFMPHVCNSGNYSLITTTGKWSYRGYTGSITSVGDNRDGECIAMCNT